MKTLTKQQVDEIHFLANLPDELIDTNDIPEQTNWDNAIVGKFFDHKKTSVVIDDTILIWFKKQCGRNYQKAISKVLGDYVQQHS